ncbi:hypothetical protein [Pullulanibacillus camelliae]|uniref:hypothetical protein n=1 Tax=Pullulanibacillus camelliae TaxID=1707096 RepID=UPI0016630DCA|nr:hypothetical protein [Pullulanibacillus camelliae]
MQYSSQSTISEGGPKNPPKGTSMKFLVLAWGAQPWVNSGSKECRAIHNGMWAMTLHSRRLCLPQERASIGKPAFYGPLGDRAA